MVVYLKRPGGQRQYSDQLRFQTSSTPRLREMVDFIGGNLGQDLSVERLAGRARLSPRHFARLFRQSLGVPPGEFVERARLSESTRRLSESEVPIEALTYSLGYRSSDAFSRAFRRQFGIAPSEYRERFRR
jgi:transcriptional regulator GlxA family with amidase domain